MSVRSRLVRLLRRSVKPVSMLAVAMLLALSLTVSTSRTAEAASVTPVLPHVVAVAEGIAGRAALPLAMPSVLATSLALHPVGWGIAAGAAVIGVGLYATQDYWLPWVQETIDGWGSAKGETNVKATEGALTDNVSLTRVYPEGTRPGVYYFDWTLNVPRSEFGDSNVQYSISTVMECRRQDGTSYMHQETASINVGSSYNYTSGTVGRGCANTNYETAVGMIAGAPGSHPKLEGIGPYAPHNRLGPNNIMLDGVFAGQGAPAFDPKGEDVKYTTTVECMTDAGERVELASDWLGSDGAAKVPSCAAAGLGHGTGKMSIDGYAPTAPGVIGTVPETIWSTTAPQVSPEHEYHLCDPNRPGSGCKLAITIDGQPCTIGSWDCENWSELANNPTTAPRVGCTYGPYTLTVDACSVMEPAYRPGGAPATEENIDGNPATRNYTQPGGQVYNPPATSTAPGGFPVTGTNPAPSSSPNCAAPAWSWNPVDFVKTPVACALHDAFVPKTDIKVRVADLSTQAKEHPPLSWLFPVPPSNPSSGCPDWRINVAGISKNVVCDSSFTAAILAMRGPIFMLMAMGFLWPLVRSLWYAAIPILRVQASR